MSESVVSPALTTEAAVTPAGRTQPPPATAGSPLSRRRRWMLLTDRAGMVALIVVVVIILIAIVGPMLLTHSPNTQDLLHKNATPNAQRLLGTDMYGRDLLARLIYGARVTLEASVIALAIGAVLGVPLGLIAGYRRGIVDAVLSRIADAMMSIPGLVLALAILAVMGPGLSHAMAGVGLMLAPRFFRVARGATMETAVKPFVEAAVADGSTSARILSRHVLPAATAPLIVQVTFGLGFAITGEASLSFLGVGVQAPTASWGSMLREAFTQISMSGWQIYPPCIAILITVLALSVLGDSLRDLLQDGRNAVLQRRGAR